MRVFMCYSHKDSDFVDRLVKDLRGSGVSVWRDVDNLPNSVQANTASWRDAVDQVSPSARTSSWCCPPIQRKAPR
jgi:hypothetical protein